MAKRTIYHGAYLRVSINASLLRGEGLGDEPRYWGKKAEPKDWISAAEDLAKEIKRHCDGVESISIESDTDDICEFCGFSWTEGNSSHNGGCCDEDAKALDVANELDAASELKAKSW